MRGDILGLIDEDLARAAGELAEKIKPLFAGKGAAVQGAALADLTALWLAGHRVPGDPAAAAELRESLLQSHIEILRLLVPLADAEIDEQIAGRRWE
jgi:hypothetical protein